jgi:hypothetical protein
LLSITSSAAIKKLINCARCNVEIEKTNNRHKYCSSCVIEIKRARDREYGAKNAEKARKRATDWHWANRDYAIGRARARRNENLDDVRKKDRERYAANPGPKLKSSKSWYDKNRDAILEANKTEESRARAAEYWRRKRAEDENYRLHSNMSRAVRQAISGKGSRSWEELVGYTTEDLKSHLERQFSKNMSWDNYGEEGWHVDHIIPRAAFAYTAAADPDFKACWALTNLRPLWAEDNLRKSGTRTHLI